MTFAPGRSRNPRGPYESSRQRERFSAEFIAALLRDFRQGGPKAIERVRRMQPASYLKICALMIPKEMKLENTSSLKSLSDEELEIAIAALTAMMAPADEGAKLIEGKAGPAALLAPETQAIETVPEPKAQSRPNRLMMEADAAVGPQERKPRKPVPSPAST